MEIVQLLRTRQVCQQLLVPRFKKPDEIISWLGAMQAQEYAMAKWAIALRLPKTSDAEIEKAFNDGKILRTHLLRPTWHFAAPGDIRWLLALTAPHVHRLNSYYYKQLELDHNVLSKTTDILSKTLEGGHHLTRGELKQALENKKVKAEGMRLAYVIMYAELEGMICSGPRKGKQFTYALLDERVPAVNSLSREEALAALLVRFFNSRGPASLKDFCYWSGLTLKEVTSAKDILDDGFETETINGQIHYYKPLPKKQQSISLRTFLMPDYDEYGMSYKDRSALANLKHSGPLAYNRMIIVEGVVAGSWQRTFQKGGVQVTTALNTKLSASLKKDVDRAIADFKKFAGESLDDSES